MDYRVETIQVYGLKQKVTWFVQNNKTGELIVVNLVPGKKTQKAGGYQFKAKYHY